MSTVTYLDGSYLDKNLTPITAPSASGYIDVYTWTIPANLMNKDGDVIKMFVSGVPSGTTSGNVVSHRWDIGGVTVAASTISTTPTGMVNGFAAWPTIFRKDSSTLYLSFAAERSFATSVFGFSQNSLAVTSASGFTIKFQVDINNADAFNYNAGLMRFYKRGV